MSTINARTRPEVADLVQELERRHKTARDYVVDGESLAVDVDGSGSPILAIQIDKSGLIPQAAFPIGQTAVGQLLSKANIPGDYGRRIHASHPELFARSVTTLLPRDGRHLVRTLDDRARAVLSDRYKVLDNYDGFFSTFKVAQGVGAEINRATLTDDRFELRFTVPEWREEFGYDDQIGGHQFYRNGGSSFVPGVYVSNSETGKGGFSVRPFIFDGVCSNGVQLETTIRQIHLGGAQEVGFLSREAADASSKAIWLQVRDLVTAVFDRTKFSEYLAQFKATGTLKLDSPVEAVDLICRDNALTDDDRQAILNELISPSHDRDPGRTVFGLISAITQRAQSYQDSDPDKATDLEVLGGKLIRQPELVLVR